MTSCARYGDLDFAERYVLGQMSEPEQADFEAHFFECQDCFAAVQALQAAQGVLRERDSAPTQRPAARARFTAAWIGLAAAATIAALLLWSPWRQADRQPPVPGVSPATPDRSVAQQTPPASPSTPSTAEQPPATAQQPPVRTPARATITLDALAMVTPPPYIPFSTRGRTDQQPAKAVAFAAAMKRYAAKDYRAAAAGLQSIVEAQPDAIHAQFFLGISYLMQDDTAKATAVLARVAASGTAPFADEAHFYLAKAALRTHDLDRAERELTLAQQRQAGPPEEAQKLLQALRTYRREHGQP